MATTEGSAANSPSSLSAAGQDEQPWLVNSSMTPRGSAPASECAAREEAASTTA